MPGSHADLPITPPINAYIVTGCGNGCQARTVNPRVYHRPAIAPLAKEFGYQTLPQCCVSSVCVSHRPGLATHRQAGWAQFFFTNLLPLAVNLFVDCCLPLPPAIDPCNTTDTATLTTLHPPSKIEFLKEKKHAKKSHFTYAQCLKWYR